MLYEVITCVSYMRQLAQKKANALIKAMPSGVVLVDTDLRVVECNRPFARLLGPDVEAMFDAKPGLEGADLRRLVPFWQLVITSYSIHYTKLYEIDIVHKVITYAVNQPWTGGRSRSSYNFV